jgi:hypothetical protein
VNRSLRWAAGTAARLPNEPEDSSDIDDVELWIEVYTELSRFIESIRAIEVENGQTEALRGLEGHACAIASRLDHWKSKRRHLA